MRVVREVQRFLFVFETQDRYYGTENLFFRDSHVGCYIVQQRWRIKAVTEVRRRRFASINEGRSIVNRIVHERRHLFYRLPVNQWTHSDPGISSVTHVLI